MYTTYMVCFRYICVNTLHKGGGGGGGGGGDKDLRVEIQHMWNIETNVILGTTRNYRKQPYWALHTYCG